MNIVLSIMILIFFILDSIVVKKYEKKVKKLTEENKILKQELEKVGVN